jgi:transposase
MAQSARLARWLVAGIKDRPQRGPTRRLPARITPPGDAAAMLLRVEAIKADIAAQIEAHIAPFAPTATRLGEIPGVGPAAARAIIAQIGLDIWVASPPAQLAAWARFASGVKESAGGKKGTASR